MRLFLIRHGQTVWNAEGRAQGHTDVPLDDVGIAQAKLMADALAGNSIRQVISSDLQRSVVTVRALADRVGVEVVLEPMFRESCIGKFEGRLYTDFRAEVSRLSQLLQVPWHEVSVEAGESASEVWARVTRAMESWLPRLQSDVAIVAHGGSCSMIASWLIGASVQTSRSIRFGNTGIAEFQQVPAGHWIMVRYNDTSHLIEPSRPMVDLHASAS
jgi:broad specificity phosphatase PhoE